MPSPCWPRPVPPPEPKKPETPPPARVGLLEGLRDGRLAVKAEGSGNGQMSFNVTNKTKQPLRVVLPPGLGASGATGQFGDGMGGGMRGGMGSGMRSVPPTGPAESTFQPKESKTLATPR